MPYKGFTPLVGGWDRRASPLMSVPQPGPVGSIRLSIFDLRRNGHQIILPGISTAYAVRLERMGISTVGDLLYHFPFRYEDYSALKPINRGINIASLIGFGWILAQTGSATVLVRGLVHYYFALRIR